MSILRQHPPRTERDDHSGRNGRFVKPCYECSACASGDDHYKYWPNTQTNADRIRSMSDEELARYIFDIGNGSEYCYGHCAYQDDCATRGLDHDTCICGVVAWLQQPAKEERHETD